MYFNSFENTLSQYNKTYKTKDLEKYLSYFDFEKMLDEEINSDEEFAQSLVFLGAMSGQSVKELKLTYLKNVENSFKDDFLNTVKAPKKSSLKSDIKQHSFYIEHFLFGKNTEKTKIIKIAKNINDVCVARDKNQFLCVRFTKTNHKWKIENIPRFVNQEDLK